MTSFFFNRNYKAIRQFLFLGQFHLFFGNRNYKATSTNVYFWTISFVFSVTGITRQFVEVPGVCQAQQNGSVLSWQILNSQNPVVVAGNTICEAQTFRVFLASLDQLPCGSYALTAGFWYDSGDQVLIFRECQN